MVGQHLIKGFITAAAARRISARALPVKAAQAQKEHVVQIVLGPVALLLRKTVDAGAGSGSSQPHKAGGGARSGQSFSTGASVHYSWSPPSARWWPRGGAWRGSPPRAAPQRGPPRIVEHRRSAAAGSSQLMKGSVKRKGAPATMTQVAPSSCATRSQAAAPFSCG